MRLQKYIERTGQMEIHSKLRVKYNIVLVVLPIILLKTIFEV